MKTLAVTTASVSAMLIASAISFGQDAKAEKVRLATVDRVHLRGTFYPSSKKRAPCVLLLHALGKDSQHDIWQDLAQALQEKGYAALAFDFRGHGDSKEVDAAEFWSVKHPTNRALVRGFPKDHIQFKDFDSRYYPELVNDIAAAKAWLDRKNDRGECNSSNLIVIGADTGATLGAAWINAECHRFRLAPAGLGFAPQIEKEPEGQHILCALWLDISSSLGRRQVNLPALLDLAGRQEEMPMVFLYGQGDDQGARNAKSCEKSLKRGKRLPYTKSVMVPGANRVSGRDLLQDRLGTKKAILEYLDVLAAEEGNEWVEHDFANNQYVWRIFRPGLLLVPANAPQSKLLNFNTYDQFLP